MLFPPHHGDPEQARLMSDLKIMIKAEGQSSIQVLYNVQVLYSKVTSWA